MSNILYLNSGVDFRDKILNEIKQGTDKVDIGKIAEEMGDI